MPTITYVCNCPDFLQQRPAMVFTRGIASSLPADWSASIEAMPFSPEDQPVSQTILGEPKPCKHIYSAMQIKAELYSSPTDYPIKNLERKKILPEEGFDGFLGVNED